MDTYGSSIQNIQCVVDRIFSTAGVYGIFARPGFGKTSLMMYFARTMAETGSKSLVFSLENDKERLLKLTHMCEMNSNDVVIHDAPQADVETLREAICTEKPNLVCIDNLRLLCGDTVSIMKELDELSGSLSVSIIITGSLPRSCGDYDAFSRRPELYDLTGLVPLESTVSDYRRFIGSFGFIMFLHRCHDCERRIGSACEFNLSFSSELIIKDHINSHHLPKTCYFDIRDIVPV